MVKGCVRVFWRHILFCTPLLLASEPSVTFMFLIWVNRKKRHRNSTEKKWNLYIVVNVTDTESTASCQSWLIKQFEIGQVIKDRLLLRSFLPIFHVFIGAGIKSHKLFWVSWKKFQVFKTEFLKIEPEYCLSPTYSETWRKVSTIYNLKLGANNFYTRKKNDTRNSKFEERSFDAFMAKICGFENIRRNFSSLLKNK